MGFWKHILLSVLPEIHFNFSDCEHDAIED